MKESKVKRVIELLKLWWVYCSRGVWQDTRKKWHVNAVKTLNLSVRSFFNGDLQSHACAMTYRTILAIVPALAMIFAIGRGFGLQDLIQTSLHTVFPAQVTAVDYAMNFVDSYLSQSAGGVFVGIGLVFLLWTVISLMINVEGVFNNIWGVKGRSYGRKITDYTAMLLILPVVMICASGLTLGMSNTLREFFGYTFLSPLISWIVELTTWILTWLFFALVYYLLPNTKVKFANALFSGMFAGTCFLILQWVFVSGQMYVAKYNAIYGSVSFLPLMLIWLQFTYVITFAGAVVCFSSQNIFKYNFNEAINQISPSYFDRIAIAVGAVVVQRFTDNKGATTIDSLISEYNIPPRLAMIICDKMVDAGIFSVVDIDSDEDTTGYQPAINPATLTVENLLERLDKLGSSDFIPNFNENFDGVVEKFNEIKSNQSSISSKMLITEIKVKI